MKQWSKGDGLGGHEGNWLGRASGGGARRSWSSSEVWVFEGPRQGSCWILVLFWEDLGGYHFESSPKEGKVGKQVEHFSYNLRGAYWHFGKGSTGKVSGNKRFKIDFGAEVCPFLQSWTKEKVLVRSPFSIELRWTPQPRHVQRISLVSLNLNILRIKMVEHRTQVIAAVWCLSVGSCGGGC